MTYKTLNNYNVSEGLHVVMRAVAETDPLIIPLLLLSIFLITTFLTYQTKKAVSGDGDFALAVAAGSYFTFIITMSLSFMEGVVEPTTFGIVLATTIVCTIFLYITRRSS